MTGFPGTTTYGSLTEEIIGGLQAYTANPDSMTVLSAACGATDTVFKVEDTSALARGVVEIGNELVYVKSVDQVAGQIATNAGWRGFRGTAAETHAVGTTVTHSPVFPRSVVRREINRVLQLIYPAVYGIKTLEFTGSTTSPHVELPADALRIVDVRYKVDTITGWERVREWDIAHSAPSEFTTGVTLDLYGYVPAGYQVQVLYAVAPTTLTDDTDAWSVTGLPESCIDVIVYGVQWRLAQNLDLARLPVIAAEADALAANRPAGTAIQVANTFYKLHTAALQREQAALALKYPARSHKVR